MTEETPAKRWVWGALVAMTGLLAGGNACRPSSVDVMDAMTSPQVRAEPVDLVKLPLAVPSGGREGASPMTTDGAAAGSAAVVDSMRADVPMGSDELLASAYPRDLVGLSLQAYFRSADLPGAWRGPEVNAGAIEGARKRVDCRVSVDLTPSRLRMVLGGGFVLRADTELRGRSDRRGHTVQGPGGTSYHVAPAGALRALFGEGRFDVAPLVAVPVATQGEGGRRFDLRLQKREVQTRAGKGTFEIAHVPELGAGGALLCRFLLEWLGGSSSTPLCGMDEVPLHAEFHWGAQGAMTFDVFALARRTDIPATMMAVPPAGATLAVPAPPSLAGDMLHFQPELAAFRQGPSEVPAPAEPWPAEVNGGLLAVNGTDQLQFVWVDGVPVAWVAPGSKLRIAGLHRGRYNLQWRTFLGDSVGAVHTVTVPGLDAVGRADAKGGHTASN